MEHQYDRSIDSWVTDLLAGLSRGDPGSVDEALEFLERDPYFFRSGYARERVARRLSSVELTDTEKMRARTVVLTTVDGQRHCPHPGVGKLARAVVDNSLRGELRARLHHRDQRVASRALRMIAHIRRPGLTPEDLGAARALALADAGRGQWSSPTAARVAFHFWSREWEAELRGLLPYHGPDRAAAKRLLEAHDRRRRPGPSRL